MDRYLNPGDIIRPQKSKGYYRIKDIAGIDISCALYYADYHLPDGKKERCILKEYNPDEILLSRSSDGKLSPIDYDDVNAFTEGLKEFTERQKKAIASRIDTKVFDKNASSFALNGTRYYSMPCINGRTYDAVSENSIYELMLRAKAIAVAAGLYHFRGLLHLDLRPERILTLPETPELVMLFDSDTVSSKNNVTARSVNCGHKDWKAPELTFISEHPEIDERADIYAIGEIIFYKLNGRHSLPNERCRYSVYSFNHDSGFFGDANPKAFPHIAELFSKTLASDISDRYESIDELISKIDLILGLLNPKDTYLLSSLPDNDDFFKGREKELSDIHRLLSENKKVCIYGEKGIGKTALALNYVKTHRNFYDAVIYINSASSLSSVIADGKAFPVSGIAPMAHESMNNYLTRKKDVIAKKSDERTLLIIDNKDVLSDRDFEFILSLPAKLILITEDITEQSDISPYELSFIKDRAILTDIFMHHYKKELSPEELSTLRLILCASGDSPGAAVLLGKTMATASRSAGAILNEFANKVHSPNLSFYSTFLSIFTLSESEKYILLNLSLFGKSGIAPDFLSEKLSLKSYASVKTLITKGLIACDTKTYKLSVPEGIKEALTEIIPDKEPFVLSMFSSVTKVLPDFSFKAPSYTSQYSLLIEALTAAFTLIGGETEEGAQSLLTVGEFLFRAQKTDTALKASVKATEYIKKSASVSPLTKARALNQCGEIYLSLKDNDKASEYLSEAEKLLRLSSVSLPLLASVYRNTASLYTASDRNLAIKYLYKALGIYKNVYGDASLEVAETEHRLGKVNMFSRNYDSAVKHFGTAFRIRKALLGKSDYLTALSGLRLGEALTDSGDYSGGMSHASSASKTITAIAGALHPLCADADLIFGKVQMYQGNRKNAVDFYKSALFIYNIYKMKNSKVSYILLSLGGLSEDDGKYKAANSYYERALKTETQSVCPNKRRIFNIASALGELNRKTECYDKAEEYYRLALSLSTELWSDKSRESKKVLKEMEYLAYLAGKPYSLSGCTKNFYRIRDFIRKATTKS